MTLYEYFKTAGSSTGEGLMIPVGDLIGLAADDLDSGVAEPIKEAKVTLAILQTINSKVNAANFSSLGISIVRDTPSGIAQETIAQTFDLTWSKVADIHAASVGQIPVPTTGDYTGEGKFSITDIFPNAAKIAAAGTTVPGVVIDTAPLLPFTNLTQSALTISASSDNREYFAALFDALASALTLRSLSDSSAITDMEIGIISGSGVSDEYYTLPDPTAGISAADIDKLSVLTRSNSITIELLLDPATHTYTVHPATL